MTNRYDIQAQDEQEDRDEQDTYFGDGYDENEDIATDVGIDADVDTKTRSGVHRLDLNFKLESVDERLAYLDQFLARPQFQQIPPTQEELEMMGNYVLWGKVGMSNTQANVPMTENHDGPPSTQTPSPSTNTNPKARSVAQECGIDVPTKHGTWDKTPRVGSLDELMEQPTFNEGSLRPISIVPTLVKRKTFSRDEALTSCPPGLTETFRELFREIDKLELGIGFWDLAHNKRTKPIREFLTNKFSEEELDSIREKAEKWTQFNYLKNRHLLVELRRQQFTLKDSYSTTIYAAGTPTLVAEEYSKIGGAVEILPLGLKDGTHLANLMFRGANGIIPQDYAADDLALINKLYWAKKEYKPGVNQRWIDFRLEEHVVALLQFFEELTDEVGFVEEQEVGANLGYLLDTLNYYAAEAKLTDLQRDVLDMKIRKVKNEDIARWVNDKYGKNYTENYISTIFRQRVVVKICEAAKYHELIIGQVFFEENFKKCTKCGRTFLRDAINFTRRSCSSDGFVARCKECEKESRNAKKEK